MPDSANVTIRADIMTFGGNMDSIRAAYDRLEHGGRLVAIVPPGLFRRRDTEATDFLDWVSAQDNYTQTLDAGSVLVVINKPPTPEQLARAPRSKLNPAVFTPAEVQAHLDRHNRHNPGAKP